MDAFPASLARSSERAPGRCRRQPSHQTGVLGIDTGSATAETHASNFAVTWPKRIFLSSTGRPASWPCLTTPRPDRAAQPTRPASTECRSSRPTFQISGGWPRTKTWPSASTNPAIAVDLAEKLIEILQSPEQQRQLAHHNFSAAMRMTMPSVVRHYLRWFELSRHKQTASGLVRFPLFHSRRSLSRRSAILRQASKSSWNWSLKDLSMQGKADERDGRAFEESSLSGDYRVTRTLTYPSNYASSEKTRCRLHSFEKRDSCRQLTRLNFLFGAGS